VERIVHLAPTDVIASRPFTHPEHIRTDMDVMRYLTDQLCLVIEQPRLYTHRPFPVVLNRPEANGRKKRLVIVRSQALQAAGPLMIVGFFGQKRRRADPTPLDPMDEILIEELPQHPGLLSYNTLELESGNFGNLVVFAHAEAKKHWSKSKSHEQAVRLAPDYYASIRIYNGLLPDGIRVSRTLSLTSVKYYDYGHEFPWRAERKIVG
jgi:hypothetical protein